MQNPAGSEDALRSVEHCNPEGHCPPPAVQAPPMPIEFATALHVPPAAPSPGDGPILHRPEVERDLASPDGEGKATEEDDGA